MLIIQSLRKAESHEASVKTVTPREYVIWLLALSIAITLGVLMFTGAIGTWAAVVPGAMGMILALWRYRVETRR
jgi:fatty acid desaturase